MQPLEFSVPYSNRPDIIDGIFKLKRINNNLIKEIFLGGPQQYSGSGRITPAIDMDGFKKIVKRIHQEGIRVNLVMNSTCEGTRWYSVETVKATMDFIKQMHEGLGVEAITIANPLYINEVRNNFKDIEIHASVLGDVDCVQRAVIFKDAGADVISTDVNINRDLGLLKRIKVATNVRLKLLVNEGCLYKCPFRKFHFNATSHASRELMEGDIDASFADFFGFGVRTIQKNPSQLLKSCWIRPEDMRRYTEITNYFKIVGRAQMNTFILRAIRAYMNESWDGDMLDLVSGCSKRFSLAFGAYLDNEKLGECGFFEKVTSCDRNCDQCDYCDELAKKLLKINVFTQAKKADTQTSGLL